MLTKITKFFTFTFLLSFAAIASAQEPIYTPSTASLCSVVVHGFSKHLTTSSMEFDEVNPGAGLHCQFDTYALEAGIYDNSGKMMSHEGDWDTHGHIAFSQQKYSAYGVLEVTDNHFFFGAASGYSDNLMPIGGLFHTLNTPLGINIKSRLILGRADTQDKGFILFPIFSISFMKPF